MARKSLIAREAYRRRMVAHYADRRRRLKAAGRWEELQKLPRDASPVRLRNRCALTGRPRGYLRKFGVCRNVFRDLALGGRISGVRKSSW